MRIPRIYTSEHIEEHTHLNLDEQAAQHLVKVLRMKTGDEISLFNNSGMHYPARLIQVSKKHVEVEVGQGLKGTEESRLWTHLGLVISRGDRMDYAIQKSTELGVSEITPLFSERCEVRLSPERQSKRQKHWQQVAVSAAEQCGRPCVPRIHQPSSLAEWLAQKHEASLKLVLHHRDQCQLTTLSPPESVMLLIGPEGGLNDNEIAQAEQASFLPTTLGPRVLRTETAPVTSLSIVQWLWGDLQI